MSEALGARLRDARLAANLTQAQLAHNLLSPSHLSLIERGRRRPSPTVLAHLAGRLGVTVASLVQHPCDTGRPRSETRLTLAQRALAQGRYAAAEREASQALRRVAASERRVHVLEVRAAARLAQQRPRAALQDLEEALALARSSDSRALATIWFDVLRIRRLLERDDAA